MIRLLVPLLAATLPPGLLAKAERHPVRVIVQLRLPENATASEIRMAQDAVVRELAGSPHRVLRRFT
jgi:hypothetical protein